MPKQKLSTRELIREAADSNGWTRHIGIMTHVDAFVREDDVVSVEFTIAGGVRLVEHRREGQIIDYYAEAKRREAAIAILEGTKAPTSAC